MRSPGPEGRPEPIGGILREALGRDGLRRGLALGRLHRAWGDIVGDRLAAATEPWSLDHGVLVVAASSGAWAAQIRFLAEDLRRLAQERTPGVEVKSVRVIVRPEISREPLQGNTSERPTDTAHNRGEGGQQ